MEYSELKEGMRFRFPDATTTWTLTRKYFREYDADHYGSGIDRYYIPSSVEEMQRVDLTPDNGGAVKTYDGWNLHKLKQGLIYHPKSGYSVGDYFEIKRDGLEPDLRGRLLEIDPEAEMWPYRVGHAESDVSAWFAWSELTKIHSIISAQRSGKAKAALKKKIEEARAELEALETALEVLEYAS
jgi:hypothetical protein